MVGGSVGFSSDLTGVEDIAGLGVIIPLPEALNNFIELVGHLRTMSDGAVNLVKAYLACSRSFEFDWLYTGGYRLVFL